MDTSGASPLLGLTSVLFWLWEYTLTRLGRRCGEEILLVATKPEGPSLPDATTH